MEPTSPIPEKCQNHPAFTLARRQMVEDLKSHGFEDPHLLRIMESVPRHCFVPGSLQARAYEDGPLAIGLGQTISQPYMVAIMTRNLELGAGDKVLEIGTGSGYQTAILAETGAAVYTIERLEPLLSEAQTRLRELGYDTIRYRVGDGTEGWAEEAPFDAILATAGAPRIPDSWKAQLAEGGRLVAPVGQRFSQTLIRYLKRKGKLEESEICGCVFVPLLGEYGWQEEDFS